jgi:SAM-dependent methyltransferase
MSTAPVESPCEGARRFSITHHHLHGVIATVLAARAGDTPVRILDVGCGSGSLIEFLQSALAREFPGRALELHGFDVTDSRVQKADFFAGTLQRLATSHPGIDWGSRLSVLSSADDWPYPDDHFDFVVSNQVLEHVRDHARLFTHVARVLRPDGLSAHLFPLADAWIEWHLKMPFAHWIDNADLLEWWIGAASRMGLGTWKEYCREVEPVPLETFARMNRDFVALETNYVTESQIRYFCKLAGLKYSFRYTDDLYENRWRLARGQALRYRFAARRPWASRLRFIAHRRISTICLVLEKNNTYVNRGFHAPGA